MAYNPNNPNGQATMANSQPVVLSSDHSIISVTGNVTTGGLTDAQLRATAVPVSLTSTTITGSVAVTGTFWQATQPVSLASPVGAGTEAAAIRVTLPTDGTGKIATVSTVTSLTQMNGQAIAMGTGTRSAGTQRVTIATDDLVPVTGTTTAARPTSTSAAPAPVTSSATSVTLKALNTARLGLSITNDSTATLYVKLGTTASATDYNVKMMPNSYWESPVNYTGRVDGIWASANGFAYVTEYIA